jgi:hypothetical protein
MQVATRQTAGALSPGGAANAVTRGQFRLSPHQAAAITHHGATAASAAPRARAQAIGSPSDEKHACPPSRPA